MHGLFAEFLRHFISIVKLIMSNNCKSRESIECAIGQTYDDDQIKVKQFYRSRCLVGVCGMFDPR